MHLISLPSAKALAVVGTAAATLVAGIVAASAANLDDSFGQQVKAQVAACKASGARTGREGIGQCVSSWVRLHNPGSFAREASESRKASEPREVDEDTSDSDAPKTSNGATSHRPAFTEPGPRTTPEQGHSRGAEHRSGSAPTGHGD